MLTEVVSWGQPSALTFKMSQHVRDAPWGWRPASFEASAPCCDVFFSAIAAGFLLGVTLELLCINDTHLQNTFLTFSTEGSEATEGYDPYSPTRSVDTLERARKQKPRVISQLCDSHLVY